MSNELVARNGLLIKNVQSGSTENEFLVKDAQGVVQSRTVNLGAIVSGVTQYDFLIWSGGTWVSTPGVIGPPTDGTYTDGFFDTWTGTTKIADAVDDLNEVIKKLAPGKPPELSTKSLLLTPQPYASGTLYNSGGTAVSYTIVSDSTSANVDLTNMTIVASTGGGFNKSVGSDLKAIIDGSSVGSLTYSDGNIHTGTTTNGKLTAIEYDYWVGTAGKSDFWPAIVARITTVFSGPLSFGSHTAKLSWYLGASEQQSTNTLTIYYDNPTTPTYTSLTLNTAAAGNRYISGVPTLSTSDLLNVTYNVAGLISQVYITTPVSASSSYASTVTNTLSGVQTVGGSISGSIYPVVQTGKFIENILVTVTATNGKNSVTTSSNLAIATTQAGKTMRVDTVSSESTRKLSGGIAGDFPAGGTYGGSYDSSISLVSATAYLYELQMLNNVYRRITGSYTTNFPLAGPNYSSDSNTDYRWVMFQYSISAKSSVNVTVSGSSFTSDAATKVTDNMKIFVKVEGVTGWLNANSPYVVGTNPISDGDKAMSTSDSTVSATSLLKYVTFGTGNFSGTFYVRLGMASGSNDTLTSIIVA